MSYPDASLTLFNPPHALAVDLSTADFDCTVFPVGFAMEIYVGVTGDIVVVHIGDSIAVTLKNAVQGSMIKGCFKTIKKTGTTATNLVARGQ